MIKKTLGLKRLTKGKNKGMIKEEIKTLKKLSKKIKKINKEKFRRKLVKATGGCDIQQGSYPCNTCFHALDLSLQFDIHSYWLAVLSFRGDYPELPPRPDLIQELDKALTQKLWYDETSYQCKECNKKGG
jgi:hypothetical protein